MKVLIWFLFMFGDVLTIILLERKGIDFGVIPYMILGGITFCGAKYACEIWDKRNVQRSHELDSSEGAMNPEDELTAIEACEAKKEEKMITYHQARIILYIHYIMEQSTKPSKY